MKTNEKYKQLISDTFIFALGNMGSKLILFFMVPLYTHFLTSSEYGIADLLFTLSHFLIPIFSLVIFDAVVRYGLSRDCKPEEVLLNGLIVWFCGTVGVFAISPLIGLYPAVKDWKWYLCVHSSVGMIYPILMNYLKTVDRNKTFACISILNTGVFAGLNVLLLVFLHLGIRGYILSGIISVGFSSLVILLITGLPRKLAAVRPNLPLLKEMTAFSTPLILNNISWWVIHSSDKVMIERMLCASVLGIYTVATKIPSLINVLIMIFSQAWGISSIKEYESTKDPRFYANVFKAYSFLVFSACLLLIALTRPFMNVYVGGGFSESWRYVPLLLVAASFSAMAAFFGILYSALKMSVRNMLTTLTAALVNIAVNYVFIKAVGVWGAVIGTVCAYFVVACARTVDVTRLIKIKLSWRQLIANCLIAVCYAVLISLDIHGQIFYSIVTFVLFIINNLPELRIFMAKIKSAGSRLRLG